MSKKNVAGNVLASTVQADDLIPDSRLQSASQDALGHEAIARGVAEIALRADAPVNIALFGPWGSGKSSMCAMLEEHLATLAKKKVRLVRYDAWKYGGVELKRNFIHSTARELGYREKQFDEELHQPTEVVKFQLGKWLVSNSGSLLLGLLVAAALAALWVLGIAGAVAVFTDTGFKATAKSSIISAGTVFGLALVAVLVGPKVLEGAVVKHHTTPPSGSDQFATVFGRLINRVRKDGAERLIVFIDELDRCDPKDVVATLVDLKTFLDQEHAVFIVAADRDVIETALREEVQQAKPVREDEPYYATPGAFLDKIFQHQIALPPLRARALTRFAFELVANQGGLWAEMRARDRDMFESVVFALVPAHVRSPRRVKVLLNNFATNARVVAGRGIEWIDRAPEIAVLTVLQTEFPAVATDMIRIPRLLRFMRGEETSTAPEVLRVLKGYGAPYTPDGDRAAPETEDEDGVDENPAGELLADDTTSETSRRRANDILLRQLAMYLTKIRAGNVPDPRPDLFYLQNAGQGDGLPDPALGDVIDFAADTAPDTVVSAFDAHPSSVLAMAVPLLVAEAEDSHGIGRMLAFESACRLIERMDPDDIGRIAGTVAPAVLAAVAGARWPHEATPGALILAAVTGNDNVTSRLLGHLGAADDDTADHLLSRVAAVLPYAAEDQRVSIATLLATHYSDHPEPLHHALETLPLDVAVGTWHHVQKTVLDAMESLENPPVSTAVPQPVPATPRAATSATPAAPPKPEPTGDGRARLRALIGVVRGRADGAALLSEVYGDAQRSSAALRDECVQVAAEVLPALGDAAAATKHALIGIANSGPRDWPEWAKFLAPASDHANPSGVGAATSVGDLARATLARPVLPRLGTTTAESTLGFLPSLVETLCALVPTAESGQADEDPDVAAALLALFAEPGWAANPTDDTEKARRTACHAAARAARFVAGADAVDSALVEDLMNTVRDVALDDVVLSDLLSLIEKLPSEAAQALSDALDEHTASAGGDLAVVRMRATSRAQFGGPPLSLEDLAVLDDNADSTEVFSLWLGANPPAADVVLLIPKVSATQSAVGEYTANLGVEDRDRIWIALEETGATNPWLRSVGRHGVGADAIEHVVAQLPSMSRQGQRDDAVDRLIATSLIYSDRSSSASDAARRTTAAKQAANAAAKSLLDTGIAGDARLAARIVSWAGGPVRPYTGELRVRFEKAGHDSFTKEQAKGLEALGLLTKKKRGLGRFLG